MATATLIASAGLVEDENGKKVDSTPFVNQTGNILERRDSGYDTDRPTGYEPVYYLIDFGTAKLDIPRSHYCGENRRGEEVWQTFLTINQ